MKNAGKNLRYGKEHRYVMDVCRYALPGPESFEDDLITQTLPVFQLSF